MADEGDNAALARAAQDLAQAADQAKMRLSVLTFDANKENFFLAKDFLDRFSGWCTLVGYNNAQKATAIRYSLTGNALVWWHCENDGSTDMTDWAEVQRVFRARFCKDPSPRYIDSELEKLRQRKHESVRCYLDRVRAVVNLLDQLWPIPATDAADVRTAKRAACDLVHDKLTLQFFLRDLNPDIKRVMAQTPNLLTLNDYVTAAIRAEETIAELQPKQSAVAQVASTDVEVVNSEPKRANKKKKDKASTKATSGSTIAPPSNPNTSRPPLSPTSVPPGDYVCRICKVPGHYIQFCPQRSDRRPIQAIQAAQPVGSTPGYSMLPHPQHPQYSSLWPSQPQGVAPLLAQPPALMVPAPSQPAAAVPQAYHAQPSLPSPGFEVADLSTQPLFR